MDENEPQSVMEAMDACRFLDARDVAKMLHISRTTLYALIERPVNPLPSVRVGKCRRFPFDKLRSWMENLGK